MDIRSKIIFIERSVWFEEPLLDLQLVEEETSKLLPLMEEDSGDDTGSLCSDFYDVMFDINGNEGSGLDSYPNDPPQFPKWAE